MHSCTLKVGSHDSHFWPQKWSKSGQKQSFLTSKRWIRSSRATLNWSGLNSHFSVKNESFLSENSVLLCAAWAYSRNIWLWHCSAAAPNRVIMGSKGAVSSQLVQWTIGKILGSAGFCPWLSLLNRTSHMWLKRALRTDLTVGWTGFSEPSSISIWRISISKYI